MASEKIKRLFKRDHYSISKGTRGLGKGPVPGVRGASIEAAACAIREQALLDAKAAYEQEAGK